MTTPRTSLLAMKARVRRLRPPLRLWIVVVLVCLTVTLIGGDLVVVGALQNVRKHGITSRAACEFLSGLCGCVGAERALLRGITVPIRGRDLTELLLLLCLVFALASWLLRTAG